LIAQKNEHKNIFGDSGLVITYWSKGIIKRDAVAPETVALADEVTKLRSAFEKTGGTISHISGDDNPADLGFHK
jgi:ribonuclease HI